MKRFLKIFVPILLSMIIVFGIGWYLISYDRVFTQDVFLSGARHFSNAGNTTVSNVLYDWAYRQKQDFEDIAIEFADKYIADGNYTKAEVTLNRAIRDGAGVAAYTKLSSVYIEQDKLLDAVELLDKIPDSPLKQELEQLRPAAPTTPQTPALYNQYIDVTVEAQGNTLYVNPNGEYPSVEKHLYNSPITLKDGENHLYAISVSDTGLASPLAVFSYTVGGIIKDMDFQDAVLEKEVRNILGFRDGYIIQTNDMWTIKEFTIPEHTKKYDDLQYMINLETLTVEDGIPGQLQALKELKTIKRLTIRNVNLTGEDMEAIGCLTSLTELTVESCGISTIAPLSSLVNLTSLNLNSNAIRNISAIASLKQLEHLHLQRNVIEDVSPIGACIFLKTLNLSYNTISTVESLAPLTLLSYLDISHNQISDITAFSQMTDLTEFFGNHNQISSLSPLRQSKKITRLDISNNVLTSLEGLKDHMNISYLNFSHNQVEELPAWPKTSKLVTVDGSYNKISDLTPLAGHENINNILMDYNENIASVDMLADCHMLIQVNVYGTKVTDVHTLTDQDIIVNAPV